MPSKYPLLPDRVMYLKLCCCVFFKNTGPGGHRLSGKIWRLESNHRCQRCDSTAAPDNGGRRANGRPSSGKLHDKGNSVNRRAGRNQHTELGIQALLESSWCLGYAWVYEVDPKGRPGCMLLFAYCFFARKNCCCCGLPVFAKLLAVKSSAFRWKQIRLMHLIATLFRWFALFFCN